MAPRTVRVGLAIAAGGLIVMSWWFPWWRIAFESPQYPQGLELWFGLHEIGGDVQEVNTLNHYIGMGDISQAALFERWASPFIIAGLAAAVVLLMLVTRRWARWVAVLLALALPVGFLVDSAFWLGSYGQHLDPRAPLAFEPFTPKLIGEGEVGQFETTGTPHVGFVLASLAVLTLVGANVVARDRPLEPA